jgi:intein/homing endonuclease
MNKKTSLARVIGNLMGDGNVSKKYLRYSNKNNFLLETFKKNFLFLYPKSHFIEGIVNSGTPFIQVQDKKINAFLLNLCGDFKSQNLRFPKFLSSKEEKIEFIRAIFDDEGCVALRIFQRTNEIKRNLEIGSKSKLFLMEIKEVLEKDFKIKCNKIISFNKILNKKEFITCKLSITGRENFIKFRNTINFLHPDKKNKLDLMISSYIRK